MQLEKPKDWSKYEALILCLSQHGDYVCVVWSSQSIFQQRRDLFKSQFPILKGISKRYAVKGARWFKFLICCCSRRKSSFTLWMSVGNNFRCEHQRLHAYAWCASSNASSWLLFCIFASSANQSGVNDVESQYASAIDHFYCRENLFLRTWEPGSFSGRTFLPESVWSETCWIFWKLFATSHEVKIEDFVPCMWLMQRAYFRFLLSGHKFLD